MAPFIDLARKFHQLIRDELADSEQLAFLSDFGFADDIGWPELLRYSRVIILAEAGAGKTREMQEQAKRLVEKGEFAFFIPVEWLARGPLTEVFSVEEESKFNDWRTNGQAPAWFFLDAVDELKLTSDSFDRALLKLSRLISGHLDRARVVISCRPSDWRSDLDSETVGNRLPVPKRERAPQILSADEAFLKVLRHDYEAPAPEHKRTEDGDNLDELYPVVMLPMSDKQIKGYVEHLGLADSDTFLAELNRQNAWSFARRPQDLGELVAVWSRSGRLGTRAEQHEANIKAKLKDNPKRADRNLLSDEQARSGAERLALALYLTRTQMLRVPVEGPGQQEAEGILDPNSILPDWDDGQRLALLRRAIFDPATYGRVRFHHRSVQEYLAARHLKKLRDEGMPTKALFRLLFSERYGFEVVLPSMEPIAAWLGLWDDAVRRELLRREPEVLLTLGDPGSLTLEARRGLIRVFAGKYGDGGWRGLNIPINEVCRLADPELSSTIRDIWGNSPENTDVREFLIELIWQGAVKECADLVHDAALKVEWDSYHRLAAIRALAACGETAICRNLAEDMLRAPGGWPNEILYGVVPNFFPEIISVEELIGLIEAVPESRRTVGGFGWELRQIAEAIEPLSGPAVELRNKTADLIWRGRDSAQNRYEIRSRFGYLTPALSILCARQLNAAPGGIDLALVRASVIASRFGNGEHGMGEPSRVLEAVFQERTELREQVFWAELAFMDEVVPEQDPLSRYHQAESDCLIGCLNEVDRGWLKTALGDMAQPDRRAVALHALLSLWHQRGRVASEKKALRDAVNDNSALVRIVQHRTAPVSRAERLRKQEEERKAEQRRHEQEAHEVQRLRDWEDWRRELLANPSDGFAPEKLKDAAKILYKWLSQSSESSSPDRYNVWDRAAIIQAFNSDIADRAEEVFRALWRGTEPLLWTEQSPEARNGMSYEWAIGLSGVSAEAAKSGWASALTAEEARLAAIYATLELNGFAPFIHSLAAAHPQVVEDVLGAALRDELRVGDDHDRLPVLGRLAYTEDSLRKRLYPHLLAALPTLPESFTETTARRWVSHLDLVFRILGEVANDDDRRITAQECGMRYAADPVGPLALTWLQGLFRFDPKRGIDALIAELKPADDPGVRQRAIKAFAHLFGERNAAPVEIADPAERAIALGRLVRCAYAFIRWEDDQEHEGAFTPDIRYHAERARSLLLSMLLDTPGPEACRVAGELAAEPDFAHFADRLRLMARQHAAKDAEFKPFDAAGVVALEKRHEAAPYDRDGLFALALDRLEDLSHEIAHHDFTDRHTLRTITEEVEMQRTLALRLKYRANGAYTVTREDEVADQKRTDIRLVAMKGDQKVAIEVKMARKWSLSELERALCHQLLGQYLRHVTCKAGCLLLTYEGKKKYWKHPDTARRMNFSDIVSYLKEKARALEMENNSGTRLAVFGLDLTDHDLVPAHR